MFQVVLLFADGEDCAVATVQNLFDATVEAQKMFSHGHLPVLRQGTTVINRWLGTQWEQPI